MRSPWTFLITGRFARTSSSDWPLGRRPRSNSSRRSLASGWSSSVKVALIPYSALRSRRKIAMINASVSSPAIFTKPDALVLVTSSILRCRKNSISNRPREKVLAIQGGSQRHVRATARASNWACTRSRRCSGSPYRRQWRTLRTQISLPGTSGDRRRRPRKPHRLFLPGRRLDVHRDAVGTGREQEVAAPGALEKRPLLWAEVERALELGRFAGPLCPQE